MARLVVLQWPETTEVYLIIVIDLVFTGAYFFLASRSIRNLLLNFLRR